MRAKRALLLVVLVGLLVAIRSFGHEFFYDPFMYFFEENYVDTRELDFPLSLHFNLLLRYLLNAVVSIGILYVALKDSEIVKFCSLLYLGFLLVLYPLFVYLMNHSGPGDYLPAFYVRRFLAHPLLVLLLLPAFLYQKIRERNQQ